MYICIHVVVVHPPVASKAAASLYALKMLKAHGLEGQALCEVTQSTLMAQLIYASSSWSGFVKAEERSKP